jgi:multidrug transporter EmrE-like cation transporter
MKDLYTLITNKINNLDIYIKSAEKRKNFTSPIPWELILLISAITVSEALGQYLLRLSKDYPSFWWLPYVTWLLYGVCTFLLLKTYEFTTIGKAEVYWDALSAIIVPIIGIYAFNNKLSFLNWVGIILVIIGTFLLSWSDIAPNKGNEKLKNALSAEPSNIVNLSSSAGKTSIDKSLSWF